MRRTQAGAAPRARDDGFSLVEMVVSITLLGIGVVAMLTALRATITATAVERDHANAHAWLQSAADVLYGEERMDCGTETAPLDLVPGYQAIVEQAENPEGWPIANIDVTQVLFWDGEIYQTTCYDDQNINLQLITIEVRNPEGEIVETVQVVKG